MNEARSCSTLAPGRARMPRWNVALNGRPSSLNTLVDLGVGVSEDASGFTFRSPELDKLTDGSAVRERAMERVDVLNGLGSMAAGDFRPVTVGAVSAQDEGGIKLVVPPAQARIESSIGRVVISDPATGQRIHTPSPIFAKGFAIADRDPAVQRALRLFGGPPSPVNLYRVFEIVRDDGGGEEEVVRNGWATRSQITRFRRTMNSVSAVGDEARHGVEPTDPPPDPMSLPEAQTFVTRLLEKWFASK
jgi:hypothetical protein